MLLIITRRINVPSEIIALVIKSEIQGLIFETVAVFQ